MPRVDKRSMVLASLLCRSREILEARSIPDFNHAFCDANSPSALPHAQMLVDAFACCPDELSELTFCESERRACLPAPPVLFGGCHPPQGLGETDREGDHRHLGYLLIQAS